MENLKMPSKAMIAEGMVQGANGLFVDVDFLMEKKSDFANQDLKLESHNKARRNEIRAPVPSVKVPFSFVMTKAVRPKMINKLAHLNLVQLDIEGDEKFKGEAPGMTRVVFNEQEIVSVGKNAAENFKIGDFVKIDFRRFVNVRDTNENAPDGQYTKYIDVPIHNIDGHDYIMIDQRDIVWVYDENRHAKELIGFEDEII